MIMVFTVVFLFFGALTQTVYPKREFLQLHVTNDGRLEAFINADDKYWMTEYGQFIELDKESGELVIAFGVSKLEEPTFTTLEDNSHIMITYLASGRAEWTKPENVTKHAAGYIHRNVVLWYDTLEKQMVMVYQSSSTTSNEDDSFDKHLSLVRKYSGKDIWSHSQDFMSEIDYPHIHFQFVESLNGSELIIPVHHVSETKPGETYDPDENYEMVVRVHRSLRVDDNLEVTYMENESGSGQGYYQASIVRVPSKINQIGEQLVAFLRDANGYWVQRSTSNDDGYTWSDPYQSAIPNPDQASQAIYLHSDLLMLIYNPSQAMTSSVSDAFSNCHHLAVALSTDYGMTWEFSRMIEYAYDGKFNNPVGIQDPTCDNIYLTYSVMTDEPSGCALLDECNVLSQSTKAFIKFTVITEQWVMNDFHYRYDYENCAWEIPESLALFSSTTFDNKVSSPANMKTVRILSIIVVVLLLFNMGACYWAIIRRVGYFDLEASVQVNHPKDYETTEI